MRRLVRIDLELECDLSRAGRTDRLGRTTDYAEIYRAVEEVACGVEHRLVEALAERLARMLCARFPIEACTVTVRKSIPIPGNVRSAGVRIRRAKGEPGH